MNKGIYPQCPHCKIKMFDNMVFHPETEQEFWLFSCDECDTWHEFIRREREESNQT